MKNKTFCLSTIIGKMKNSKKKNDMAIKICQHRNKKKKFGHIKTEKQTSIPF